MSILDTTNTSDPALSTGSGFLEVTDPTNTFSVDLGETVYTPFMFGQRNYSLQCDPITNLVGTSQQTWVIAVLSFVLGLIFLGAIVTVASQNRAQRGLEIANMRQRYAQRQNRQLDVALTQKQNLITALTATQRELETASQQKSSFMSYLCHELRSTCLF
jgi:hypothetical protein